MTQYQNIASLLLFKLKCTAMEMVALGLSIYVNICTIFATLSVSFFLLSHNEAFSFDASYGKRAIFGVVGGVIALSIQRQNGIFGIYWPAYRRERLPRLWPLRHALKSRIREQLERIDRLSISFCYQMKRPSSPAVSTLSIEA